MTVHELAASIDLHPDTLAALGQYLQAPESIENKPLQVLAARLQAAILLQKQYAHFGIPERIYYDTVADIKLWSDDYREKTGEHGVRESQWLSKITSMQVIRIGRLQYEPQNLEYDISLAGKTYPAGTEVLEIHIPAGEPLDEASVCESLSEAPLFFEKYFHKTYKLMRCRSWLLAPELREMLKPASGIIAFQNLFSVYKAVPHVQAIERVFGKVQENASDYPENTSLQRNLKAYLLSGKQTTMGCGIIDLS